MTSKRYRIVCVDDDRDTCDILKMWLKLAPFEYDVEAVDTSIEALELINHNDTDLYVLDTSVVRDSRTTLLETIRAKDKLTPVLMFTGAQSR